MNTTRFLIVTEKPLLSGLLKEILETISPYAEIHVINDAIEILESIKTTHPSMVFIDKISGKMDSFVLAAQIRAYHEFSLLPLILMSKSAFFPRPRQGDLAPYLKNHLVKERLPILLRVNYHPAPLRIEPNIK